MDARQKALEDRVTCFELGERRPFVLLMGLGLLAGAEVDGGNAERGETSHVGPRLLRLHAGNPRVTERAHERMLGERRRRGRKIGEAHLGATSDQLLDFLLGLLQRRVGRETVVDVELEAVGDDVATAPPSASVTLVTVR